MAPLIKLLTLLTLTLSISAQDTAAGTQFITGTCTSDADCASACCGFTSGKCAAPFVANERGEGCGFGDAAPNNDALGASQGQDNNNNNNTAAAPAAEAAAGTGSGSGAGAGAGAQVAAGSQFITGACTSDADCAAGCCGFNSGKCAGPVVAQERDGGCGFGDAAPNDDAAKALQARSLGRKGPALM